MKKLFPLALVAALAFPLCAQDLIEEADEETLNPDEELAVKVEAPRKKVAMWPAFVGVCEWPETPDLVGIRFTIPFSTRQENVTGIDLGLWSRTLYFEGIQLSLLRNDVKDSCAGVQVGLYNSVVRGDLVGLQVGLWNESNSFRGLQCGLVNVSGDSQGLQVGLINRSETMYGFQFGLINVIRDAEVQFFPFVNIGF